MRIDDELRARQSLSKVGYYRLSGYSYPMRNLDSLPHPLTPAEGDELSDLFIPGSKFQDVVDLWQFDQNLKRVMWKPIEAVEISLRTAVAHVIGEVSPMGHLDPSLWREGHRKPDAKNIVRYDEWVTEAEKLVSRSKEKFMDHYREKYDSEFPIWVAAEAFDFGALVRLYSGLEDEYKDAVADSLGIPRKILSSWVTSFNDVRNIIAHHGRLWNRHIVSKVSFPHKDGFMPLLNHMVLLRQGNPPTKVFQVATALAFSSKCLLSESNWCSEFKHVMDSFPDTVIENISLKNMGFPDNWDQEDLWKDASCPGDTSHPYNHASTAALVGGTHQLVQTASYS